MLILKRRILTLSLCFAITGCASIVSKSDKLVTITSNPTGANFVVKKANGLSMTSGITPATITLGSSDGYFRPPNTSLNILEKESLNQFHYQLLSMDGMLEIYCSVDLLDC